MPHLTLGVSHEKLWIQHSKKDIFNAINVFSPREIKGRAETMFWSHGLFFLNFAYITSGRL
jgi:hypothetical protein